MTAPFDDGFAGFDVHKFERTALIKRDIWFRRFSFTPGDGFYMMPAPVDFLINPKTWYLYRLAILMRSYYPPPQDLLLFGTPVLLSHQVPEDEIRLALA